jgi:hypothetical protein
MGTMDREALSKLIQRFAISALSRERKNEALNEEILVGKYTGEFYIKTKDGIIVSNDILDRSNSSMNNAIRIAEMVGMTGELFKVDFDELELPSHVDYTVNFLNMEPIQIPIDSKNILLYLDIDEYVVKEDKMVKNIFDENLIHITISCLYDDGSMNTIEVDSDLQNINYTKIPLDSLQTMDKNVDSMFITNIYVTDKVVGLNDVTENQLIILHNIFITIDK